MVPLRSGLLHLAQDLLEAPANTHAGYAQDKGKMDQDTSYKITRETSFDIAPSQ